MMNETLTPPLKTLTDDLRVCRKLIDQRLNNAKMESFSNITKAHPIVAYIADLLERQEIRKKLKEDHTSSLVLKDTLNHFLLFYEQKTSFRIRRHDAEFATIRMRRFWTPTMCLEKWKEVVNEMEQKYDDMGFMSNFYNKEFRDITHATSPLNQVNIYSFKALWNRLLDEWEKMAQKQLENEINDFIESQKSIEDRLIRNNLEYALKYKIEHNEHDNLFRQIWMLMGGRWNTVEYERMRRVANLQNHYPILIDVANDMGRRANNEGTNRIRTSSGGCMEMEHASKSDIVGISMGNDINSLLPQEMAMYTDEATEDIFFKKYISCRLQTFLYKSQSNHPSRSLRTHQATKHGPMVVCVDTSGSMQGVAEQIALSLCMRLTDLCHSQHRACYLIAFSVQARPIDVMNDRTQLLNFFQERAHGNTDARHMLDETFRLLKSVPIYRGADVLWISDFRIPIPEKNYLTEMERLQQCGTRWLGLQIGIAENHWTKQFERIYAINEIMR